MADCNVAMVVVKCGEVRSRFALFAAAARGNVEVGLSCFNKGVDVNLLVVSKEGECVICRVKRARRFRTGERVDVEQSSKGIVVAAGDRGSWHKCKHEWVRGVWRRQGL